MTDVDLPGAIERSIQGLRLLHHPLYLRWQDGQIGYDELARYAEQYRHFERCLPEVLFNISQLLPQGECRDLVESNLRDELSRPRPHVELFEQFAGAVGAKANVPPTVAVRDLIAVYHEATEEGAAPALAVLAAYEIQAADIAASKAIALAREYRLGVAETEFWTVHADVEQDHAEWTTQALEVLEASPESTEYWASHSARHWWAFLDERNSQPAA